VGATPVRGAVRGSLGAAGVHSSRVWVAHGMKIFRCSPEQLSRPSEEQEKLIRLLPDHLRVIRSAVAERGAGNVVVLEGGAVPPFHHPMRATVKYTINP